MTDTTERSNTAGNTTPRGRPFAKGDPRINRNGRPKSFDALRKLAQQIAHEETALVVGGHKVTVAEAILRQWAQSKNPQLQRAFVEIAFGKVPDRHEITGADSGPIRINPYDYNAAIAAITARPGRDSDAPGED
jgi:hypothetical protein